MQIFDERRLASGQDAVVIHGCNRLGDRLNRCLAVREKQQAIALGVIHVLSELTHELDHERQRVLLVLAAPTSRKLLVKGIVDKSIEVG